MPATHAPIVTGAELITMALERYPCRTAFVHDGRACTYGKVGARRIDRRISSRVMLPHSPFRTGHAAFTAPGSPLVGQTSSFSDDRFGIASTSCRACLRRLAV